MTASRCAGWLSRWTSAPLSRASLSSREARSPAASRKIPSVDGPCSCRRASRSCRGQRRRVAWLEAGPGAGEPCSGAGACVEGSAFPRAGWRGGWRWVRGEEAALSPSPSRGPSAGDTASAEEPAGWGPPGQACLPGWAGAACHLGCRELPGAGRREPPCRQSPTARAPLQRPRSLAAQRARAAPSSSCGSRLLPRKREQRAMEEKRQASAPGPSQRCPPAAERTGEASFGNEGPRGLSSLLPQSNGDGRALREGQQQPQCSTSARLREEERRTVLPPSSPNSPAVRPSPPWLPEGTGGGRCSAPACKKHAALTQQPRSRKGPRRAASAPGRV